MNRAMYRSRVAACAAIACAVATFVPAIAKADPPAVRIDWSAPDGCPDGVWVRGELERLLGGPLEGEGPPRFTARASVVRDATGRWQLQLATTGDGMERERSLGGQTCEELAGAAALIVALAVDPVGAATRAGVRSEPGHDTPNAARAGADSPARAPDLAVTTGGRDRASDGASRAAPAPSELRWVGRASALVDAGALPHAAPGLGLMAAGELGSARVEVLGAYFFRQRATVAGREAGADVSLVAGAARLCAVPWRGPIEAGGCLGFEAGALLGEGFGVSSPDSSAAPWLAPEAGLFAAYTLTRRLGLTVALDALVPLARKRFVLTGVSEVFTPPPFTVRAGLGLELRFP